MKRTLSLLTATGILCVCFQNFSFNPRPINQPPEVDELDLRTVIVAGPDAQRVAWQPQGDESSPAEVGSHLLDAETRPYLKELEKDYLRTINGMINSKKSSADGSSTSSSGSTSSGDDSFRFNVRMKKVNEIGVDFSNKTNLSCTVDHGGMHLRLNHTLGPSTEMVLENVPNENGSKVGLKYSW